MAATFLQCAFTIPITRPDITDMAGLTWLPAPFTFRRPFIGRTATITDIMARAAAFISKAEISASESTIDPRRMSKTKIPKS
jgi:hypothetical protein